MKVIWSRAAENDLLAIGTYIGKDDPDRAISFVEEIIHAGEAIADMPRAFALVPRLEAKSVRNHTYGAYLIFYRINGDAVQILHVAHGARDYTRALFGGE